MDAAHLEMEDEVEDLTTPMWWGRLAPRLERDAPTTSASKKIREHSRPFAGKNPPANQKI